MPWLAFAGNKKALAVVRVPTEEEERRRSHTQDAVIESSSTTPRPKGLGALTEQILHREACDWKRFQNRRQVSSYLGLCPSENSSGARQHQGHVTKSGNPRLRWALCEAAWRLVRYQPGYRGVRKWREYLVGPKATPARKKQALVALACTFGVD